MKKMLLTICCTVFLFAGFSNAEEMATPVDVVLTPLKTDIDSATAGKAYEHLKKYLEVGGTFKLAPLSDVEKNMKLLGMEPGKWYVSDDLVKLGKAMNIKFVIAGSILKEKNMLSKGLHYTYQLVVYDVATGKEVVDETSRASVMTSKKYLDADYQIRSGAEEVSEDVVDEFEKEVLKTSGFMNWLKSKE